MSTTRIVADHLAAASSLELPDDVERKTIWHTLDTVAASISGSQLLAGRRAREFADLNPMPGPAPLWGHQATAHPVQAAFVNAMAAHADETDDSHAPRSATPAAAWCPPRSRWPQSARRRASSCCAPSPRATTSAPA